MGLFLLIIFVGVSLALLTLRAWAAYDEDADRVSEADPPEAANEEQTPLMVALVVVTLLSSGFSELLRHSFKLSFLEAFVVSVGILVAGQWLVLRFFPRRPKRT